WARAWRTKARDEEVLRLLAIDPHAPDEIRCNAVVRNLDEFHTAFDVQAGDGLYLPPEERVQIWCRLRACGRAPAARPRPTPGRHPRPGARGRGPARPARVRLRRGR